MAAIYLMSIPISLVYRMIKLSKLTPIILTILFISAACSPVEEEGPELGSYDVRTLPMQRLQLDELTGFQPTGDNWTIAGNVQTDYQTEHSMDVSGGTGVLVNLGDGDEDHIFTDFEHGDIELKLEFLVPRGSNSGLYFQSRYEVQILDSWRVEYPQFSDLGGIYARWDGSRPDGDEHFEGSAPSVNAALAPGLWQEYHILFRAPRFDDAGNKTANARFEWVELNGVRVQENVELSGPTREAAYEDESETAPLMIQGDHGPVAFRNMEYKLYGQTDSLSVGELNYRVYDYEGDRTPVNFDELELLAEGTVDSFNVSQVSPKGDRYAVVFTGDLNVPVSGDYLFQKRMNNGGNFYINDELIIENTGELDSQQLGRIIHLDEGTHDLKLTHFQIQWGTYASLVYEGPGMERRSLASTEPYTGGTPQEPLTVQPESDRAEIIGGFTNYGGEKRTHTLSVGHPDGIHYSYDLNRATLLKVWRNPFADVSQMWQGRGHEQRLVPMNAAVEEASGIPFMIIGSDEAFENHRLSSDYGVDEYQLNSSGEPTFMSRHGDVRIEDHISPSDDGTEFIRTLRFERDEQNDNGAARIAQGSSVEQLPNGLYRVNGRYYLDILDDGGQSPEVIENGNIQALIIPVLRDQNSSEIRYQLIW